MTDWIKVEDRLPDNSEHVQVVSEGMVRVGGYAYGTWFEVRGWPLKSVTHWKPLDDPPLETNQ